MSDPLDQNVFRLLSESYERLIQRPLVPSHLAWQDRAHWLYHEAPYCVLAHNRDPDPRFVYANTAAQVCFEYGWDEITTLPSRLSAEAHNRSERQALLDQVTAQGYATGYRGLRIAKTGRRFWIDDGTVWQLIDAQGVVHGQAALFTAWHDA